MTIDEYMKLSVQGRLTFNIIQLGHRSRLDKLIEKRGNFKYNVYNDSGSYIIHFKIPSETYDDIEYDSIIKLVPNKSSGLLSNSVKDYDLKFFSNSPDFVYYFSNLFYNSDMFISELSSKLPNECFEIKPTIINKENDISNCKSLYWICLLINDLHLDNKINLKSISKPYNKEFINNIKDFSLIDKEIKISRNNKIKSNKNQSQSPSESNINKKSNFNKISNKPKRNIKPIVKPVVTNNFKNSKITNKRTK